MAKLKRVYEAAEDEGRPIQEVALERYASVEDFEEALEERRVLDERADPSLRRPDPVIVSAQPLVDEFGREIRPSMPKPSPSAKRILMNTTSEESISRPSSRQAFRRPGQIDTARTDSGSSSRVGTPLPTHVPSVFTPPISGRQSYISQSQSSNLGPSSKAPLSQDALNRMQAKVLKAKLMDLDSAETEALEQEFEEARALAHAAPGGITNDGPETEVRVLPTLDGHGQLYDMGGAGSTDEPASKKRRRNKEAYFESRDVKTGEVLRYNADDDSTTLEELVRQERFRGGAADQKNIDAEYATRVMKDGKFQADLDYIDDEAERLARKRQKTADQKRMFAINGRSALRLALCG
jgi:hypothetical protein